MNTTTTRTIRQVADELADPELKARDVYGDGGAARQARGGIMKLVKIRVLAVGQSFGCTGQIVARNGRICAETAVYPLGFATAAERSARDIAARHGWQVVS